MAKRAEPAAERYARDVADGKIKTGKYARLACERHLRDLKDGHKRGLVFRADRGARAIGFYDFLRHSKGEWAGQKLELQCWPQFRKWSLVRWYREDGTRRCRPSYM